MDIKNDGLTEKIIEEALVKARNARLQILEKMLKVLPRPRTEISQYAPKIAVIHVPEDKIGAVIGPGGKVIRKIISETGVTIDVNDEDEQVTISGTNEEMVEKAKKWVEGLVRELVIGEEFEGEVKRILNFGAFVEVFPGKEGLVHVSKMARGYVKDPSEVVKIGQKVKVKVAEIDDQAD